MFIYKKNKSYRLSSIIGSKFKKSNYWFNSFNIIFLMKNQKKDPIIFLFLILYLFSGKVPQIIKKSLKKKKKFLGFRLYFKYYFLQDFIMYYFSILDNISILNRKSNLSHNFLVVDEFPVLYEIDYMCEQFNPLLEFIKSYKLILYIKVNNYKSWYESESIIRLNKFPFLNNFRV